MTSQGPTGFVVGLAIEARVLSEALGEAAPVACAAARPRWAREWAERLLADGADGLVSFGIAGGLDPGLSPGDLVLPERIVAPDGEAIACDSAMRSRWQRAAAAAGQSHAGGSLVGSDQAVVGVADKRRLYRSSGAVAVDMESLAVARVAGEAGVPFAAVRAVSDPAGRPLPRLVLGSIAPDGTPRLGRLARRACLAPWEVPALFRLRRDTDRALASLARISRQYSVVTATCGPVP